MQLAADPSNRECMVQEGAARPLVRLLSEEWQEKSILIDSATALASLAYDEHSRTQLSIAGAVKPLVRMIAEADADIVVAALRALQNIAKHSGSRLQVVQEGGLQLLLQLVRTSQDNQIVAGAAHALANVAMDGDFSARVVQQGGVQPLIQLCRSVDPMVQWGAASALATLRSSMSWTVCGHPMEQYAHVLF